MKKHVFLVDEDKNELTSFMQILRPIKDSIKCKHAESGRQAIEMLQHTIPDYIFIDYGLSEMNALQVVSAIRFQSRLKETKVYLYSDYISDDISKMARMLGATGCVEKSGEFSSLVHKFKAIFSPELLPAYAFLKNNEPVAVFYNNRNFLDENYNKNDISNSSPHKQDHLNQVEDGYTHAELRLKSEESRKAI